MVAGAGSAAGAAELDKVKAAEQIVEKLGMTQANIAVQLIPMMKNYPCLDNNFKDQWIKLNKEAAEIASVDKNFVSFLINSTKDGDLKAINESLELAGGRGFIEDLRNPKFKAGGELYYPSLAQNKDKNVAKISRLISDFSGSNEFKSGFDVVKNPKIKENLEQINNLTSLYLTPDNGLLKCKLKPTTN